jgi:hypothetical protein
MNIRRAAIAATGGAALAALTLGALPVGAQEGLLPIGITPTSGPAGTTATIAGTDCLSESGPGDLEAYMWTGESAEPVLVWSGTVNPDGSWTAGVTFEATDPVGVYTLSATCFASPESADIVADYDYVDFELTGAPAPEAPADPVAPAAAPAAPVAGQPRYTG